jgi:MinD-like ATPase involved in chromosome partitioning or flagellar assembly
MERTLITVVGPRRRANLAVPSQSPIRDLLGGLAERCGEPVENGGNGRGWAWSIVGADSVELPADRSLAECGIVDGAVVYLRGIAPDGGTSVADARAAWPAVDGPPGLPAGGVTTIAGPAEAARASPLPDRVAIGGRLLAAAGALVTRDPRSRTSAGRVAPPDTSPASLTRLGRDGPVERVRLAWRATDYVTRLDQAIAAPRLRRCATIAVMSPKGGVGKTTVTALIGTLLAHVRRDRVVAVDTNPDWGSLGRSLTPAHNLFVDDLLYLLENPSLTVAALDHSLGRGPHGLMVLPAPTDPARMARLDETAYVRVIRRLQDLVGVVILDCGTGLQEPAALAALKTADEVILVTDAEPATASLVAEASRQLSRASEHLVLAVNKMPASGLRLDVEALARAVSAMRGVVMIPAHHRAASRLAGGEFDWRDAPKAWHIAIRELAATLLWDWRELELAT